MHPVLLHIGAIVIPSYGAIAALGLVVALLLAQHTARVVGLNAGHIWNLCVIAMFAALVGSRLLLLVVNWAVLSRHPAWILQLGMIHHPLVSGIGAVFAVASAWGYARWQKLSLLAVADVVAAPLALGLAFEQFGQLLAGSGFGMEAPPHLPWAVTYTSPLAARWSGAPLGLPLHPVQAYAALGFLLLAVVLLVSLPRLHRRGDTAGLWLMGTGVVIYITELWRDHVGRGSVFDGLFDGPQIAAIAAVLAGAFLLRDRKLAPQSSNSADSATDSAPHELSASTEHD